jgi:LPS sulfotransferase NodH
MLKDKLLALSRRTTVRAAEATGVHKRLSGLAHVSVHEEKIAEAMAGTNFDGAAPVFDMPLVLLGFTNRSGSNLLAEYMASTGGIGRAGEMLNWKVVLTKSREHGIETFPDYVRWLSDLNRRGDQAMAIKASAVQVLMLLRWRITAMFPAVYLVRLIRGDLVAQAVSYSIAAQSGVWTSAQQEADQTEVTPKYDFRDIAMRIDGISRANSVMAQLASVARLPTLSLEYESLAKDPAGPFPGSAR